MVGAMSAVVAAALLCGLTGCAAPARFSGVDYLSSLESSHRLDGKAEKLCTKEPGGGVLKPVIAVNSSLLIVRRIEPSALAAQNKDPILSTKQQGYAAICLFHRTYKGQTSELWVYELPDGSGFTLEPGY
jgi:hypothetical protein